jgi:hypothetical protein
MNAATLILCFAATTFGVLTLTRRTPEQFGPDYLKWMEPPSPASAPPDKDDDPKVTVRRMAHEEPEILPEGMVPLPIPARSRAVPSLRPSRGAPLSE